MSTAIVILLVLVIILADGLRRLFRDRRERIAAEAALKAREPNRERDMMAVIGRQRRLEMSGIEEPVMPIPEMAVTGGEEDHAA